MLGYVLNRFSFQNNEEKNLIGLTLYVKGSVVEYKDCMKFAFFVFFSLLLSLEIYMVFCALQVVSMASAEERKKYYLNWDTLNFHTITCNCFLYHFFFRSAFLCYLFEFNRNSMDVKETVERSRDSMNPTEICCECDCVILFRVFFLLIYLEIHMHEYLVWVALSSHVTQYNIHLIWSIRTDHTQRGVSICFF